MKPNPPRFGVELEESSKPTIRFEKRTNMKPTNGGEKHNGSQT
jgi:hypothetical protein